MAIETIIEILLSGSASAVLAVVLALLYKRMKEADSNYQKKIDEKDGHIRTIQEKRHTEQAETLGVLKDTQRVLEKFGDNISNANDRMETAIKAGMKEVDELKADVRKLLDYYTQELLNRK